jgi:hypothetical protein
MKKQYQSKNARRNALPPAWRPGFERLDAALRENTGYNNARTIALLRKAAFADVAALEASGEVVIPVWEP